MPNQYHATAAAIRSAYGHRLRGPDYRDLMNLHSVAEIVSYLKGTDGLQSWSPLIHTAAISKCCSSETFLRSV